MPRKPTDTIQVNLRIKEALRRRLEAAAKQHDVSLNGEMINRLVASFDRADLITLSGVTERIKRAANLMRYAAEVESRTMQEELMEAAEELIEKRNQATVERVQKAIAAIANKYGQITHD